MTNTNMTRGVRTVLTALAAGLACSAAHAQPRMTVMGGVSLTGISANGGVVVGVRGNSYVRWQRTGSPTFGNIPGGNPTGSLLCSADGSILVGTVSNTAGLGGLPTLGTLAARWTVATSWATCPPFSSASQCGPENSSINSANGMSTDGRFAVGGGWWNDGVSACRFRAFSYDHNTNVMTNLGNISGVVNRSSRANCVTTDGSLIAGYDENPITNVRRPAVWVWNGSTYVGQVLPTTGDPQTEGGEVYCMNSAGTVLVGSSFGFTGHLVTWTPSGGNWVPHDLGIIPARPSWVPSIYGITSATGTAISDDGNTIVGSIQYSFGGEHPTGAFIWKPAMGVTDLYDYLVSLNTIGLVENFPSPPATPNGFATASLGNARCSSNGQSIIGSSLSGLPPWMVDLNANACIAPVVSVNPSDNSGIFGNQAIINAGAIGSAPMTFQWLKNDAPISDGTTPWGSTISGSSYVQLRINNPAGLQCEDQGTYSCTFTNACGSVTTSHWTVVVATCCFANCDYSTAPPILNANDFQCFLNRYAAADNYANCDGSTAPPILNANDFQCFLNSFAAGCP